MSNPSGDSCRYLQHNRGLMPREEYPQADILSTLHSSVSIYHPGYDSPAMLRFPRTDGGGVWFDVVFLGCCIIAGNVWKDGKDRVGLAHLLPPAPDNPSTTSTAGSSTGDDPGSAGAPTAPPNNPLTAATASSSTGDDPGSAGAPTAPPNNPSTAGSSIGEPSTDSLRDVQMNGGVPYLSLTREDPKPIVVPEDGILYGSKYWFIVPEYVEEDHLYPVYTSFFQYTMPKALPRLFRDLPDWTMHYPDKSTRENSIRHTEACRLTGESLELDEAHIIPKAQKEWMKIEDMLELAADDRRPLHGDNYHNISPMAQTPHSLFDKGVLCTFPKRKEENGVPSIFCHVLKPTSKGSTTTAILVDRYHNKQFESLYGIPREYLFARFAWSLFQSDIFILADSGNTLRMRLRKRALLGPNNFGRQYQIKDGVPSPADYNVCRKGNSLSENTPGSRSSKSAGSSRAPSNKRPRRSSPERDYMSDISSSSGVDTSSDDDDDEDDVDRMTADRHYINRDNPRARARAMTAFDRMVDPDLRTSDISDSSDADAVEWRGRSPTKRRRRLSSESNGIPPSLSHSSRTVSSKNANSPATRRDYGESMSLLPLEDQKDKKRRIGDQWDTSSDSDGRVQIHQHDW